MLQLDELKSCALTHVPCHLFLSGLIPLSLKLGDSGQIPEIPKMNQK